MNLPGPNSRITWKDYKIDTPTFDLSSIEKPDLSPFLIHMTGKDQLLSILKGENSNEEINVAKGQGYLKSNIPKFHGAQSYYNSKVVSFTESPLFALDFFRYRSFKRWESDQQFGIGFSKSVLVKHCNVRPVLYLETETNRNILSFFSKINDESFVVTDNKRIDCDLKQLVSKIKPLLFPLLENEVQQGFMWEREWRCPNEKGMTFPLSSIKVICCPKNERGKIKEIIGEYLSGIIIVESWKEYNDIVGFLKNRNGNIGETIENNRDINDLKDMELKNKQTYYILSSHYNVFKETVKQLEERKITEILAGLETKMKKITDRIQSLNNETNAMDE